MIGTLSLLIGETFFISEPSFGDSVKFKSLKIKNSLLLK